MRKILLFIACLMVTGTILAQKVSKDEAMEAASSYLGIKATRGGGDVLKLAHTQLALDGTKNEDIFVFNNVRDGGFVMVAGDFRASSLIIGYSDEGSFEADKMPENMKWWFSELARQIDFLRNNKAEVQQRRVKVEAKAMATSGKVAPLLEDIAWGQAEPFNNLTPVKESEHCKTGCVATAMAQIMYFHKWPLVGTGQHEDANEPGLTVDFSKSEYQWSSMKACAPYSETQGNAIAKLMLDCGVAVDMTYGVQVSGALSYKATNALKTYFGYSSELQYVSRTSQTDWDDMMVEELEHNRPILYSGSDPNAGGHAFVCDGYETSGGQLMFHINWGWEGQGNCYTVSSVMEDEEGGHSFSSQQSMIIGIEASNKKKSGVLYYSIIDDDEVQVTYPSSTSEYTGDIVIPASVTIDAKTYFVTAIKSNAFRGCTGITSIYIPSSVSEIGSHAFDDCPNLENLYVNWTGTEYIPFLLGNLFDYSLYNHTNLVVPNGTVADYADLIPWRLFPTIKDNNGTSVGFTEWTLFGSGRGTYTYDSGDTQSGLEILSRTSKNDGNICQLLIKGWKNEVPFFFMYDKRTNDCDIPEQSTGMIEHWTDGVDNYSSVVFCSDVPTYTGNPAYRFNYPATYDPATGLFSFSLAYYQPGVDLLDLRDEAFQLSFGQVRIVNSGSVNATVGGRATQTFEIECGTDIKSYKYAVVKGQLDREEASTVAQEIANGTIASTTISNEATSVTAEYPAAGLYTFVIIGLDSSNSYDNQFAYQNATWAGESTWKQIATGTYTRINDNWGAKTKSGLVLSQNIQDESQWKISNAFGGVEFYFTWDQATDIVTFDEQLMGYVYNSNKISVFPLTDFYPSSENQSCFDRASNTFKFKVVYGYDKGDGYYSTYGNGTDTFVASGLTSCTMAAVDKDEINKSQVVFSGNNVNIHDNFKSISITGQKSNVNIYYTREFSSANVWQSWFVPFDVSYYDLEDDYEVGEILGMTENAIIYKEVTSGTVYANTPYIVKPKKAGLITTTTTSTLRATSASPISGNVAGKGDYEIGGVYAQTVNNSNGWYAINKSGNFQKMGSSVYLRPFRIYMTADWIDGSSSMDMIDISDVTGIEDQLTDKSKASGTRYNLAGQAVGEDYKGIVIKNGKKHLAR